MWALVLGFVLFFSSSILYIKYFERLIESTLLLAIILFSFILSVIFLGAGLESMQILSDKDRKLVEMILSIFLFMLILFSGYLNFFGKKR